MRYHQLTELFNKPADYEVTEFANSVFSVEFLANNKIVKFDAITDSESEESKVGAVWEILFAVTLENGVDYFNMTGSGDEFLIMSTVKAVMHEFFHRVTPPVVKFSASNKDQSRVTLYTKMAMKFIPKIYSMETRQFAGSTWFYFTKGKSK